MELKYIEAGTLTSENVSQDHRSGETYTRSRSNVLDVFSDDLGYRIARHCTDDPFLLLTTLKKDKRRDPADAITLRDVHILIHVHLEKTRLLAILFGDCFDRRCDHAARSTPLGPKIDEHGLVSSKHIFFEISISYVFCKVSHINLQ